MNKKRYATVMLDPPWMESGGGKIKRGADKHYPLMKTKDIIKYIKLEVVPYLTKDGHIYMWVTNNFLPDGLKVLEECGFRYITNIVWVKDRMGLGFYFRGQHELCLFATRGKTTHPKCKNIPTIFEARRTKHSKKPENIYHIIEEISPGPYAEIFARLEKRGWTTIGNEVKTKSLI